MINVLNYTKNAYKVSFCSLPNHTRYIILTFGYVSLKGIPFLPLFFLPFEISWQKAVALNKC